MTTELQEYLAAPVERIDLGTELCYRRFGQGPALILVHGWPLNGATWRGLVRRLSPHFTCFVPDLPGAGASPWDPNTREIFVDWGKLLARFVSALELPQVALIGHDSGGGVARTAAAELGDRVSLLGLIDTEVTGYTPPLVRMYKLFTYLPFAQRVFSLLAGQRWYRRSALGFGGCFADLEHLDGDFHKACVEPVLKDPSGAFQALAHADLSMRFGLRDVHRRIRAPVLMIWGEQDPFFPLPRARAMQREFRDVLEFCTLRGQKTFVHDERPDLVAARLLPHLLRLHGHVARASATA